MRTSSQIPNTNRKLRIGSWSQARGQRLVRSSIQGHAAAVRPPPARLPPLLCHRLPPPRPLPLHPVLPLHAGRGGAVAQLRVETAGTAAVVVGVPAGIIQNAVTGRGDGTVETGARLATGSAVAAVIDGAVAATVEGREREAETERGGKRGAQAVRRRRREKRRS